MYKEFQLGIAKLIWITIRVDLWKYLNIINKPAILYRNLIHIKSRKKPELSVKTSEFHYKKRIATIQEKCECILEA